MITGKVTVNREAVIELEVAGPAQQPRRIQAVIDTGYNGYITLPSHLITALQLPFVGHRRGMLADGSVVLLDVFSRQLSGTVDEVTNCNANLCCARENVTFGWQLWLKNEAPR